jgi:hypothetical protein
MSTPISSRAIISPSSKQLACDLEGDVVLLNSHTGLYYGLEGVGARVWSLIQEPRSVGEIRDALVQEFDVEPERCEQDLLHLIDGALKAGLIEVKDIST